jgi:uncharacterized damage-inducible protein DinB
MTTTKCSPRASTRAGVAGALIVTAALAVLAARAHAAAPAAAKSGLQGDLIMQLDDAQKKIDALEGAVPQDKFSWRPAPGVRSIGEAYMHIAFGNYFVVKLATGKAPPADVGFDGNPEKWDKSTSDKAAIKKALDKSFEHARAVIGSLSDADLDKKVTVFGHEATTRAVLIGLIGHVNEHLGQSIAYARSNNVVPPWSEKNDKKK